MDNNNLKKVILPYIQLILLPCIFSLILYLYTVKVDNNHEIEKIKIKLSERATDFMSKTTAVDYFKPYFKELANKIFSIIEIKINKTSQEESKYNISKLIDEYSHNLNENIRCAVFDKKARLVNNDDLFDYEQRFFTYAWKTILGKENAKYNNFGADQDLVVGMYFNYELMVGYSELCMPTFSLGKTGVFYFKKGNKKDSGIIIFVEYKRTNLDLIKAKIEEFATNDQPIILYDIKNKLRISPTLGHKEIYYDRTLKEEFLNGFIEDNVIWKGFNADDYKLLLGQKIYKPQNYHIIVINISIIFFILFFTTLFFFKNFSNDKGIFFSIRYKLIFIFSIAVYIPTLGLWVLSYTSLHDHRKAIENKVKKGMLDIINKVDFDYKIKEEEVDKCYLELDNYLKSLKGKKYPPIKDEFSRVLRKIVGNKFTRRRDIFNWVDIRAVDKSQIYTTSTSESNSRIKDFGRVLSIICLDKYCPERLTYAGVKPSQSDILVGNILENPMMGFSFIYERPKQLIFQKLDTEGVYWWWNYYPDKDNPVAFFMGNSVTRNIAQSYFSLLSGKRFSFENTEIKIINYHSIVQQFYPDISNKKEFLDLINVSNINNTLESANINYKNNNYLCLCKPGSNLKDCFTIGMYPLNEIDYQIDKARNSIYVVMILLLIISVFTGLLLSKHFIIPVNELNRGLEALRKRETETIINIENKDELGHLGQTFNQMMLEIKDMLLAGAVQQCLIPTGNHSLDGYDCIIYNRMATDVGGDYADKFDLPDNRLLIVIGDVNGHGVSSSLVAAMVKASVFLFAKQDLPLNEIVKLTSYMLCDLLDKKMFIQFCAIILDKNTGKITLCNAGHPYPFIREKEIGKLRILTNINLPMGISKSRSNYVCESSELKPEDTLFLYTDGFFKAIRNQIDEYGFENLKSIFSKLSTDTVEEVKNQLVNNIEKNLGKKESGDDISFIILKRKPLQNN